MSVRLSLSQFLTHQNMAAYTHSITTGLDTFQSGLQTPYQSMWSFVLERSAFREYGIRVSHFTQAALMSAGNHAYIDLSQTFLQNPSAASGVLIHELAHLFSLLDAYPSWDYILRTVLVMDTFGILRGWMNSAPADLVSLMDYVGMRRPEFGAYLLQMETQWNNQVEKNSDQHNAYHDALMAYRWIHINLRITEAEKLSRQADYRRSKKEYYVPWIQRMLGIRSPSVERYWSNPAEYWSIATEIWFGYVGRYQYASSSDENKTEVFDAAALETHDPRLALLLREVYGDPRRTIQPSAEAEFVTPDAYADTHYYASSDQSMPDP
jgi:hypothetical protein